MVVDFRELKERVSFEQVLTFIGWEGKRKGDQLKGGCPICSAESERAFVVTLSKGLCFCFACRKGGDQIQLVAEIYHYSTKAAAELLAAHFKTENVDYSPSSSKLEKVAAYLDCEHPAVLELMPQEVAEALGVGWAPRGTMAGRVLIPMRTETGKLVGYVGVSNEHKPPLKVPKVWHMT